MNAPLLKTQPQSQGRPSAKAPDPNPVLIALSEMATTMLGAQLAEMFDKADDILFDSAEKARGGDEQRLYLDTMRTVRVQRKSIIERFHAAMTDLLDDLPTSAPAAEPDPSDWSLQDGDELEEQLAIASMESKASAASAQELDEFARRLRQLQATAAGAGKGDLSPARIIRSFQAAVSDLSVDFPIKLVIYKLFDRVVLARLSEVFAGGNQLLEVNGFAPAPAPAQVATGHGVGQPAQFDRQGREPHQAPQQTSGSAPRWSISPEVMAAFGAVPYAPAAAQMGGPSYVPFLHKPGGRISDDHLAHEIRQVLGAYHHGRAPNAPAWMSPESVALVAGMFDRLYRGADIPESIRPAVSRLHLPTVKTALNDPTFVTDREHPLRRAIQALRQLLVRQKAPARSSPSAPSHINELVDELVRKFDSELVDRGSASAIDDDLARQFLESFDEAPDESDAARPERIRRIVSLELQRKTDGKVMAPSVTRLLLSGCAPMLAFDYARGGVGGAHWSATMQLVVGLLEHTSNAALALPDANTRLAGHLLKVQRALQHIGFSDARIHDLVDPVSALAPVAVVAPAEEVIPASPMQEPQQGKPVVAPVLDETAELKALLSILLVHGTWYTVIDPSDGRKHWLRAQSYYPQRDAAVLTHYMEPRVVTLQGLDLAGELQAGAAAVIDPSSEVADAVNRLLQMRICRRLPQLRWAPLSVAA